ncbi:ATP synthase subunit gamma, mitochondrial [Smittium mucronatum]|uniref:ATP synthase subunit gamma n=1 Tax=Smittium mucronatum TaxID=133383 RepID=A0A1R0GLU7_9FUNG|nr:ATP synthase subunit gamma, mitochondrial [Smittium mucronatum]
MMNIGFTAKRVSPVAQSIVSQNIGNQTRNMATLKEIQLRLKSITNISKITKSMKMIASTKTTRAQRAMEASRQNGMISNMTVEATGVTEPENSKKLIIVSSSDKGLCGGIHSSVSRYVRNYIRDHPEEKVVVLGDKSKSQLMRMVPNNLIYSFNQIGRVAPTFEESCAIATKILEDPEFSFDTADIIYNKFVSAISYEATVLKCYSKEQLENAPNFAAFEVPDGVMDNYNEFLLATNVHWAIVEGHASEMAAKRAAMDNATSNAQDLIGKLTLQYNRGRQAVITNQLIEVITGASAL